MAADERSEVATKDQRAETIADAALFIDRAEKLAEAARNLLRSGGHEDDGHYVTPRTTWHALQAAYTAFEEQAGHVR